MQFIAERSAPDIWQEACAAGSAAIAPMQLRRATAFDTLAAEAFTAAGGRLPPRSRLLADALVPLIERPVQQEGQAADMLGRAMHAEGTALAAAAGALAIH